MWRLLLFKFQCFDFRPVLLKTGSELLVANIPDPYWGVGPDGTGENRLGQLLMEIREIVRQRLEDNAACQCPHEEAVKMGKVCVHFLENQNQRYQQDSCRIFSGHGFDFIFACSKCASLPADDLSKNLRIVCGDCLDYLTSSSMPAKVVGLPEFSQRNARLSMVHQEQDDIPTPLPAPILDIQPVTANAGNVWVALTADKKLWQLDFERRSVSCLIELPESSLDFSKKITLHLSRSARFAAVVNTRGQNGLAVDLSVKKVIMLLDRGNYRIEHSNFSTAFFDFDNQTWLVHATNWNRLDISNPQNGELATWRISPVYKQGEKLPEHYLDYFHCGLRISPDQSWIVDNGWVWSPFGSILTWNLPRWLIDNVWESEDGPTKKVLCSRHYYWDGPLCWIDNHTLAVWGYGDDESLLVPAVRIFDVLTGEETRWFAGPTGELVFDHYLFSFDQEHGLAVWDVQTGERLYHEPDFCPTGYHPGAKTFLTVLPEGKFRVSRLVGI